MKNPGPHYRMSKAGKISLAMNWHRAHRKARKLSIIQAELYGSEVVKSKKDRDAK